MGPKKKSQKKFERKHLSGEIVRRKHAKVAAQRRRAKEMRLAASMKDDEEGEESDEEGVEGEGAASRVTWSGCVRCEVCVCVCVRVRVRVCASS